MPEKLKNLFFTEDSINSFAISILNFYPEFDKKKFHELVYDKTWNNLELKAKMRHTTKCLHLTLPSDYTEALIILLKASPEINTFSTLVS